MIQKSIHQRVGEKMQGVAEEQFLLYPRRNPIFLDPRVDVVFKKIFLNRKHLLMSLLNALITLPEGVQITNLEYLSAEQVPVIPEFRTSIVDVKCFDQQGRTFVVEMQVAWVSYFIERMLYNSAQAYVQRLHRGDYYDRLSPVYGLALIDANFDKSEQWYHHYLMTHKQHHQTMSNGIELILIELRKFKPTIEPNNTLGTLWLRFFTEAEKWRTIPEEFHVCPEILEAAELSREAAFSDKELYFYQAYWDGVSTHRTLISRSIKEGIEQGMQQGMQQGMLEGALQKTRQLALKLMASGFNDLKISSLTDLSLEEVKRLRAV